MKRRLRGGWIVLCAWVVATSVGSGIAAQQASEEVGKARAPIWEQGPTQADFPHLLNLKQFSEQIYSGGEPEGEASFREMKELGIETVVSVDGARPNVDLAKKYGLRYVHIPIGYDGVPEEAKLSLARLMRETSEPIYVHCHHGRHRGPAAAAVACQLADQADHSKAIQMLQAAGTSKNYTGLWRDVGRFRPVPSDASLPDLVSVAEVDSFDAAMASIDRRMDHLKACQKADWSPPSNHPDLVPSQEALLVKEDFREAVRKLDQHEYDTRFRTWMKSAENEAADLRQALEANQGADASVLLKKLGNSCKQCHDAYRN